jgi:hypothetical protein
MQLWANDGQTGYMAFVQSTVRQSPDDIIMEFLLLDLGRIKRVKEARELILRQEPHPAWLRNDELPRLLYTARTMCQMENGLFVLYYYHMWVSSLLSSRWESRCQSTNLVNVVQYILIYLLMPNNSLCIYIPPENELLSIKTSSLCQNLI